jgi:hypothetical protein
LFSVTTSAHEEARALVAGVRGDPAARLELATRFYDSPEHTENIRPYRRAETAFMRWQIGRGVLAPPKAVPPAVRGGELSTKAYFLTPGKPGCLLAAAREQ